MKGKRTVLACFVVGVLAAGCVDDGGSGGEDALIVVTGDAAQPDAPVPDAPVPDARVPDADLSSAPPAFRVTKIWVRDPHLFTPAGLGAGISCLDITDNSPIGFTANGQIQTAIDTDGDGDSLLDLSLIAVFDPLSTIDAATGNVTIATGDCNVASPRFCSESTATTAQDTTYTNTGTGACMTLDAQTLSPANYSPAIAVPSDECFATGSVTLDFNLAGASVTLQNVEVAAIYNGDPNVQSLVTGVMRGFLSEADAAAASIPTPLGNIALPTLLPGTSACKGLHDDRDNIIPGDTKSTRGWWFYLNFEATRLLGWAGAP